ncbi:hypothetical protein LTR05_007934 [Lithohypha guttulata]|uniref:DUF7908 domain-containing protein n=1 Tax=Lithohypha guttulata TaxID=1690604 RepID=A0AAN7Y8I8_9EURO|nr:hypothetical protein LTR05_007934 [Lithohypha guttulata]
MFWNTTTTLTSADTTSTPTTWSVTSSIEAISTTSVSTSDHAPGTTTSASSVRTTSSTSQQDDTTTSSRFGTTHSTTQLDTTTNGSQVGTTTLSVGDITSISTSQQGTSSTSTATSSGLQSASTTTSSSLQQSTSSTSTVTTATSSGLQEITPITSLTTTVSGSIGSSTSTSSTTTSSGISSPFQPGTPFVCAANIGGSKLRRRDIRYLTIEDEAGVLVSDCTQARKMTLSSEGAIQLYDTGSTLGSLQPAGLQLFEIVSESNTALTSGWSVIDGALRHDGVNLCMRSDGAIYAAFGSTTCDGIVFSLVPTTDSCAPSSSTTTTSTTAGTPGQAVTTTTSDMVSSSTTVSTSTEQPVGMPTTSQGRSGAVSSSSTTVSTEQAGISTSASSNDPITTTSGQITETTSSTTALSSGSTTSTELGVTSTITTILGTASSSLTTSSVEEAMTSSTTRSVENPASSTTSSDGGVATSSSATVDTSTTTSTSIAAVTTASQDSSTTATVDSSITSDIITSLTTSETASSLTTTTTATPEEVITTTTTTTSSATSTTSEPPTSSACDASRFSGNTCAKSEPDYCPASPLQDATTTSNSVTSTGIDEAATTSSTSVENVDATTTFMITTSSQEFDALSSSTSTISDEVATTSIATTINQETVDTTASTTSMTTMTMTITTSSSSTTLSADTSIPTAGQPFSIQVEVAGSKHKRAIVVVGFINGQLVLVSSPADAVAFVLTSDGVLMIFGTGLVVGFGGGSGTSALMIYSSVSDMPTTIIWSVSGGALVLPGAGFCVGSGNVMSVNVGTATDDSCAPVTPVPDTAPDSYNTEAAATVTPSPQTSTLSTTSTDSTTIATTTSTASEVDMTTTEMTTTIDSTSTITTTEATSETTTIISTTIFIGTSTTTPFGSTVTESSTDSTTSGASTTEVSTSEAMTSLASTTTTTATGTEETDGPNCSILPLEDQTAPNGSKYTQFFYSCHASIPPTLGDDYRRMTLVPSPTDDPTTFLRQCVQTAEENGATVWTYYQSTDFSWNCGFWKNTGTSSDIFVEDSTVLTMNAMALFSSSDGSSSTTTTTSATTTETVSEPTSSTSLDTTTSTLTSTTESSSTTTVEETTSLISDLASTSDVSSILQTSTTVSTTSTSTTAACVATSASVGDTLADSNGNTWVNFFSSGCGLSMDWRSDRVINSLYVYQLTDYTYDDALLDCLNTADYDGSPVFQFETDTRNNRWACLTYQDATNDPAEFQPYANIADAYGWYLPNRLASAATTTASTATTSTTSMTTFSESTTTSAIATPTAVCEETLMVDLNGDSWQVKCDTVRLGAGDGPGTSFILGTDVTMSQCIDMCDDSSECNMVELGPDDSGVMYCWGFTSVITWVPVEATSWNTALKISGNLARDPVTGNTLIDTTITTSSITTTSETFSTTSDPATSTSDSITSTSDATTTTTSNPETTTTSPSSTVTTPSCTQELTYCASVIAEIVVDFQVCADSEASCEIQAHELAIDHGALSFVVQDSNLITLSRDVETIAGWIHGSLGYSICGPDDVMVSGLFSDTACALDNPAATTSSTTSTLDITTTSNDFFTTTSSDFLPTSTASDVFLPTTTTTSEAVTTPEATSTSGLSGTPEMSTSEIITSTATTITEFVPTSTTSALTQPSVTFYIAIETASSKKSKRDTSYLAFDAVYGGNIVVDSIDAAAILSTDEDGNLISIDAAGVIHWYGFSGQGPSTTILTTLTEKPSYPVQTTVTNSGTLSIGTYTAFYVLDGALYLALDDTSIPADGQIVTLTMVFDDSATPVDSSSTTTTTIDTTTVDIPAQATSITTTSMEDVILTTTTSTGEAGTTRSTDEVTTTTTATSTVDETTTTTTTTTSTPSCTAIPFGDTTSLYDSTKEFKNFYTGCGESVARGNELFSMPWPGPDHFGDSFEVAVRRCAFHAANENAATFVFYTKSNGDWFCHGIAQTNPDSSLFQPDADVVGSWGFMRDNQCGNTAYGDVVSESGSVFANFYTSCSSSLEGNTDGGLVNLNRVVSLNWIPDDNHLGWSMDAAVQNCADQSIAQGATMFEFYVDINDYWYCIGVNDLPAEPSSFYPDLLVNKVWGFALSESADVCTPLELVGSVTLVDGTTFNEFYDACHMSLAGTMNWYTPAAVFSFQNPPGDDSNHGGWTLETSLEACVRDSYAAGATIVQFYETAEADPTWYCAGVYGVAAQESSFNGDATVGRVWALTLDAATVPEETVVDVTVDVNIDEQ